MDKFLAAVGIALTVIYLAAVGFWVCSFYSTFSTLQPNNIGDFLGGVFGPLAFLWLVLGYFQQGIELRQNRDALLLQAQELNHSVEQQRAMVKESKLQRAADADRLQFDRDRDRMAASPRLIALEPSGHFSKDTFEMTLVVRNLGTDAFDLAIIKPDKLNVRMVGPDHHWPKGEKRHLLITAPAKTSAGPILVGWNYKDVYSIPHAFLVRLEPEQIDGGQIIYKISPLDHGDS